MRISWLAFVVVLMCQCSCDNNDNKTNLEPLRDDIHFFKVFGDCFKQREGRYEAIKDINLRGKSWDVPNEICIDFCNHSIINGSLNLGNKNTILNGRFVNKNELTYRRTHYDGRIIDYCVSLSIIDKEECVVRACEFFSNIDSLSILPTENLGIMVYGTKDNGCVDIKIEDCKFEGCSCNFFSNVSSSNISKCEFNCPKHMLSVETIYNLEHDGEYSPPRDIVISDCSFVTKDSDPKEPPLWISGVEDLLFINNYCESDNRIMMLYCGDFDMGIRNVKIENSKFLVLPTDNSHFDAVPITCRGKSYKWPSTTDLHNSILFNRCTVERKSADTNQSNGVLRGINAGLIENFNVSNSEFVGFVESIAIYDSYRGIHYKTTEAEVKDCIFRKSKMPLAFEDFEGTPDFRRLVFKGNSIEKSIDNENLLTILSSYGNCMISDNVYFE